jgi:hypothetical protein
MNIKPLFWILAFVLVVSAVGCQQQQESEPVAAVEIAEETTNKSDNDGLDATSELVLGTLRLEDTADAVTPEQAVDLLSLWQIIQGGSLKSAAETAAVLTQIRGKMSETQLAAIESMALTAEDMQGWMAEQGIEMPGPQAAGQDGEGGSRAAPEGIQNLSEEERAQMQNMTPEERATRMAEMGIERPEGQEGGMPAGAGGGMRQANLMIAPLIDLLTARAAV